MSAGGQGGGGRGGGGGGNIIGGQAALVHLDGWTWERSEERRVGKECRSLCDWSSDVCSSDLHERRRARRRGAWRRRRRKHHRRPSRAGSSRRLDLGEIGRASCRERV